MITLFELHSSFQSLKYKGILISISSLEKNIMIFFLHGKVSCQRQIFDMLKV